MKPECLMVFHVSLLGMAVLCYPNISFGQGVDFSGTWLLTKSMSISGTDFANVVPDEIHVTQEARLITIARVIPGKNGEEVKTRETIGFKGKQIETAVDKGGRRLAAITWSTDMRSFTERVSNIVAGDNAQVESTVVESWRLADSGKTLIVLKTRESTNAMAGDGNDNWSMKGFYE